MNSDLAASAGLKVNKGKKKRVLALMAVATCTVALYIYFKLKPSSMIEHARKLAYAQLNGNTDLMFEYMMPEEPQITGITRQSFRDAYHLLIAPRLKQFNVVESEHTDLLGAGDEGSCNLEVQNGDGVKFSFYAGPFLADDGLGAHDQPNQFGRLLKQSWLADYALERQGRPPNDLEMWKLILRELDKDLPTLNALRIKGMMSSKVVGMGFTDLKLITWDEYRRRLVKTIARLESVTKQAPAAPAPAPPSPPASRG